MDVLLLSESIKHSGSGSGLNDMGNSQIVNSHIIFYDGNCALCHWSVRFILRRDKKEQFLFAPIKGKTWKVANPDDNQSPDVQSVIYSDNGNWYEKSDAVIAILLQLGPPWSWIAVFSKVPLSWRDWIYDQIANNRYKWFGGKEDCSIESRMPPSRSLD
jgi:predicted DCC family thiol-disulfide oxidoreductase YuxK